MRPFLTKKDGSDGDDGSRLWSCPLRCDMAAAIEMEPDSMPPTDRGAPIRTIMSYRAADTAPMPSGSPHSSLRSK